MFKLKKRLKNYVSPIDQFLKKLAKDLIPSRSQQAEIDKYQKIMALRDHAAQKTTSKTRAGLWEGF